jgi:predicted Holliday junction resolvase-like endonuclease
MNRILILSALGLLVLSYITYTHITLQASQIDALKASEKALQQQLEHTSQIANHNAEMYLKSKQEFQSTLDSLHELQKSIDDVKDKSINKEKVVNRYVDSLDKESFESKCFNMSVPDNVGRVQH